MTVVSFINFLQPYFLEATLDVPEDIQGRISGNLTVLQEIILIIVGGIAGAYSDKVGRRIIFSFGFVFIGIGFFIYPLAVSVTQLFLFRAVFAVGVGLGAVMFSACVQDYPKERSRGRWIAIIGVFTGLGAMFMALVLSRMPAWLITLGFNEAEAGMYACWFASLLSFLTALVLAFGISNPPREKKEKENHILSDLFVGLKQAKNPRLALAYFTAFIGRGDLVVIAVFFSLWFVRDGADLGVRPEVSIARAGMLFGIVQLSALLWGLVMGTIVDKVNRVHAVCIAYFIATLAYLLMGLYGTGDPNQALSSKMILFAIFLGMGEISVINAGGAILGQEAPPNIRGSIMGVFAALGAAGIIFASSIGGMLFDNWLRSGPFIMMGVLNGLLLIFALTLVYLKLTKPKDHQQLF
ncbi:MAG TPA: MFS transporter [Gammaproteobacteria bacterium]|nr:MFS transporter [Gammaproteobacteria bacterium]